MIDTLVHKIQQEYSILPLYLGQYAKFSSGNSFSYSQQMQSTFALLLAIKSGLMKSVFPGFDKIRADEERIPRF